MKTKHVLSMIFVCVAFLTLLGRGVPAAPTAHAAAGDENWSALGSGINGCCFVKTLATVGNNLYAGGQFTAAGGISANHIAKWDGSSWSPLGTGVTAFSGANIANLAAASNGNLYAGGAFTTAGSVSANNIAKWDGSDWSALGSGILGDPGATQVGALALDGNNLYVGGRFTTAGGISASHIAKWDGSNWSAVGGGMNDSVTCLLVVGNNLYAGGTFTTAGGVSANHIAKWDGSSWSPLGSGMDNTVSALAVDASGNLYAGGSFSTAGGVAARNIAKWNGSTWSAVGYGLNGAVRALAIDSSGNLYAGGAFSKICGNVNCNYGNISAGNIAKWSGANWSPLGSGVNDWVHALAISGSNLYVGGLFTAAGGKTATCIAKWALSTNRYLYLPLLLR